MIETGDPSEVVNLIDVAIIGAGAAGLMAAAQAGQRGTGRVLVLEKTNKAGTKILMSGGTRCNLTHDCDAEGIMRAFGRQGNFLRQALAMLSPSETVAMFHRLGLQTKVESTGKVFPIDDRAVGVRDVLLRQAEEAGAEIRVGSGVVDLQKDGDGFSIATSDGSLRARRVIVTVGGKSWPQCGTTGDGYDWLQRCGHTIEPLRPSLVPLIGGQPWSHALSGLTLEAVRLSVWRKAKTGDRWEKRPLVEREGGFLFTHFGFSGPAVMDVSRELRFDNRDRPTRLTLNLLPAESSESLHRILADRRQHQGSQSVAGLLADWLPKRLAETLAANLGLANKPIAEVSKAAMVNLVNSLVALELPVRGTRGFEKAEVTAGGVRLKEIDPRTLESRLVPGLFIAGEILDLDGWIGGYNFQSAFSTGFVAGQCAVRE